MGTTNWLRALLRTVGWILVLIGTSAVISAWSVAFPGAGLH